MSNYISIINEEKLGCLKLYHSTTKPISGEFKIKGTYGYGAYFAGTAKDSQTFGNITYEVKICPENTFVLKDSEVRGTQFYNMPKQVFEKYINDGYDSVAWYRGGKIKEFIVLVPNIVKDYEVIV